MQFVIVFWQVRQGALQARHELLLVMVMVVFGHVAMHESTNRKPDPQEDTQVF